MQTIQRLPLTRKITLTLATNVLLSSAFGSERRPSLSSLRFNLVDVTPWEVLDGANAEDDPARIERIATVIRIAEEELYLVIEFEIMTNECSGVAFVRCMHKVLYGCQS